MVAGKGRREIDRERSKVFRICADNEGNMKKIATLVTIIIACAIGAAVYTSARSIVKKSLPATSEMLAAME
jgi:hypothetical protein